MACDYNIVIIDDEKAVRRMLKMIFKTNGFNVYSANTGREGMIMITSNCPDIIILDLNLPDMDGMNIIKSIREWSDVPIIVLSARSRERDKVSALDNGADDYITKPFGTSELLARVRTSLRHSAAVSSRPHSVEREFSVGSLKVDFARKRVLVEGVDAELTQNEYKIVSLLAKHPGKVLTYEYLIRTIWGPNMKNDNQILRVNMSNIRRKVEKNPAKPVYLITEIGVGYRLYSD